MLLTDQTKIQVDALTLKEKLTELDATNVDQYKTSKTDFADRTALPDTSELILDKCPLTVTSDGREPISGMNLGDYIPEKVEIDGVWYDNPSGGGRFAFFEDWKNLPWKETTVWTPTDTTVEKQGDWLKITATADWGDANSDSGVEAVTARYSAYLVKKGVGANTYLGSTSEQYALKYTWSTDTAVDGDYFVLVHKVRISDDLLYIVIKDEGVRTTRAVVLLENLGDYCYITKVQAWADLEFTPPFGQDGNPKNPALAYNFDKWDHPISFKFQPQFNYDVGSVRSIITDSTGTGTIALTYQSSTDLLKFSVLGIVCYLGHNGSSWDDSTAFTDNTVLQQEHDFTFFVDKDNDLVNVWIDGENVHSNVALDLSGWESTSIMCIGGSPYVGDLNYSNSYISNFAVHDKTATLPIDQTLDYYDPNRTYGLDDSRASDMFGNEAFRSVSGILGSAGSISEEGSNVNGKWMRFSSGMLVQLFLISPGTTAAGSSTDYDKYLPVAIKVEAASDDGAYVFISGRRSGNPSLITMGTGTDGLHPDYITIRVINTYSGTITPAYYGIVITF